MADDRTLAPSASRWSRAWQAGLRPWSGWLLPAAACGLLVLAIDHLREAEAPWLDVTPGTLAPAQWLGTLADRLGLVLVAAGVVVFVLALLSQRLGWIATFEQGRLQPAPAHPAVVARLVLTLVLAGGVVLALTGVLAGAARAVDASETGLAGLWLGWAERAATVLAAAMGLAAVVELVLDRRDRDARLWQTPEQALDDARAAGGRSR